MNKIHFAFKKTIVLLLFFVFLNSTLIYAQEGYIQYKLIFEGSEKPISLIKNENGIMLAPLKEVIGTIGFIEIEECGRCGYDSITSADKKEAEKIGNVLVHWLSTIVTFNKEAKEVSLDAATEKDSNGVTYTSLKLYKYLGYEVEINELLKIVKISKQPSEIKKADVKPVEKPIQKQQIQQNDDAMVGQLSDTAPAKRLVYAFDPNCSSCKAITQLLESYGSKYKVNLDKIDITSLSDKSVLEPYYSSSSVPDKLKNIFPILFIGSQYLFNTEITSSNISQILNGGQINHNFISDDSPMPKFSPNTSIPDSSLKKVEKKIVYFYSTTCASCRKTGELIDLLQKKYSDVTVLKYNIADIRNMKLLNAYGKEYGLSQSDMGIVPALFISDAYLVTEKEIEATLEGKITGFSSDRPTILLNADGLPSGNSFDEKKVLRFATILSAGLVNGINPCSLSMFLFLMSLLIIERKLVLKIGLSFIFGKFIMFFLLGTLFYKLLSILDISWVSIAAKVVVAVVVIVFALLNINDYFAARNDKYDRMILQLPSSVRGAYHGIMKKIVGYAESRYVIVVMILLGMLIALGEFLCTGQVYLTSVVFLIQSSPNAIIPVFYLLLYSAAFIAPLLALTLLINKGSKVFKLSEKLLEELPYIKIISAALFILFGVYIIIFT